MESATPHEVTLVHATLAQRFVNQLPVRLIGDNAYESDRLDAELARRGVELIAPHYERLAENFLGILQLASCLILFRGL